MSVEALVATYGYPVLLLGAIFEGETILMAGGFLAHRGYLDLHWVLLTALLGTMAVDQFFFHLGRSRGLPLSSAGRHGSFGWTKPDDSSIGTRRPWWWDSGFSTG